MTAAQKLIRKYEARKPKTSQYAGYARERRYASDIRKNKQRRRYKK